MDSSSSALNVSPFLTLPFSLSRHLIRSLVTFSPSLFFPSLSISLPLALFPSQTPTRLLAMIFLITLSLCPSQNLSLPSLFLSHAVLSLSPLALFLFLSLFCDSMFFSLLFCSPFLSLPLSLFFPPFQYLSSPFSSSIIYTFPPSNSLTLLFSTSLEFSLPSYNPNMQFIHKII